MAKEKEIKNLRGIQKIIASYTESFRFFYGYMGYRIGVFILISLAVGLLDGLGLSMFLPLLQMVSDVGEIDVKSLGKLSFVIDGLKSIGIKLELFSVLVFMCLFFALKGIAVYFQAYYQASVLQYFIRKIRIDNIEHFNLINFKYFIQADVGQIQNTLTGEVNRIGQAFNSYFLAFQQGIMVLVYISFAFLIDAKFALLVSVGGVFTNVIFKLVYQRTKTASIELTQEMNAFQGLIIQYVGNFKYLKATNGIPLFTNKLSTKVEQLHTAGLRIGILTAILKGAREPLIIFVVAAVILLQVQVLGSPIGPILISLLFFYRALNAVMGAQTAWNYFLGNSGSLINVTEFTETLKNNKEEFSIDAKSQFEQTLELRGVSVLFANKVAIEKINLTIEKNKSIALVGESGSGKTTLVNVITGLIPTNSGAFYLDGEKVDTLNNPIYQQKVGYITQEPVIFSDTIFNNVTLWAERNSTNRDKFQRIIREASLEDFVADLELRENTLLDNNGLNLSGGQRQRISIARELYKDIDLLILDEATSALDSTTEQAIQAAVEAIRGKYTILSVAHRLSTIRNADMIVFMRNGRIAATGTFTELAQQLPEFKRMIALQEI
jgi:subfamily B ATP-binding cassette protein MsbA